MVVQLLSPIVAEPVEERGAAGAVPRLALTRSDGSFENLGLENTQPSSLWRCIFEHETLPPNFLVEATWKKKPFPSMYTSQIALMLARTMSWKGFKSLDKCRV